jgi:thioesterase domain-containing protein
VTDPLSPVIFLPGAGGGSPDLTIFSRTEREPIKAEVINYPDWKRYTDPEYSAESLISELTEQIAGKVPYGAIRIIGLSIGGHFGYAAACRLQAMGRVIGGFCAIDAFMITSAEPSAGWWGRALMEALELVRNRRFIELIRFSRSKFWRAFLRACGGFVPRLFRTFAVSNRPATVPALDPILESELNIRLLIRLTAPWIASLDRDPVALIAPTALLRTRFTAADDVAWRRRCPTINIQDITGSHHVLFEPENVNSVRQAFARATGDWY